MMLVIELQSAIPLSGSAPSTWTWPLAQVMVIASPASLLTVRKPWSTCEWSVPAAGVPLAATNARVTAARRQYPECLSPIPIAFPAASADDEVDLGMWRDKMASTAALRAHAAFPACV